MSVKSEISSIDFAKFFSQHQMLVDNVGMCKNGKFLAKLVGLKNFISPTELNMLEEKKNCFAHRPLVK
jgi:hypothetical protein